MFLSTFSLLVTDDAICAFFDAISDTSWSFFELKVFNSATKVSNPPRSFSFVSRSANSFSAASFAVTASVNSVVFAASVASDSVFSFVFFSNSPFASDKSVSAVVLASSAFTRFCSAFTLFCLAASACFRSELSSGFT